MKSYEDQFESWLAGTRADLFAIGVPSEQVDQVIADFLGENNLDAVRAKLPPLGGFDHATEALRHYIALHTHETILELDEVIADERTQSRAALSEAFIKDYAADIAAGATFPPVVVFYDGEKHYLADGFHRLAATKLAGRTFIAAIVKHGTLEDAILYSVGANHEHGNRRTNADKRHSVEMLLTNARWVEWSDREIARHCGVSYTLVDNMRKEISGANGWHLNQRKGRDGKVYDFSKRSNQATPGAKPTNAAVNVGGAVAGNGSMAGVQPLEGARFGHFPLPPQPHNGGDPMVPVQPSWFNGRTSGHQLDARLYFPVYHDRQLIGSEGFPSFLSDQLRGTPWAGYALVQGIAINSSAMYEPYTVVDSFPPPPTKYWHGRYGVCPTCSERAGKEIAHGDWEGTESPTTWHCPRCQRRWWDAKMKIVDAPTVEALPLEENDDPLLDIPGYVRLAKKRANSKIRRFFEKHGHEVTAEALEIALDVNDELQEEIDQIIGVPYGGGV